MLKRKMTDILKAWRNQKGNECLLVKGARQVGKTFTIEQFGHTDYKSLIKLDFIKNPEYMSIFEGSLDAHEIYSRMILVIPNITFIEGNTLVFIDEIQECPQARTALKYLAQDTRYDVIASGSLLGIAVKQKTSVPVGYEREIKMHALDFEEFLWACGFSEDAVTHLRGYLERTQPVPASVHESMMRQLRSYLAVGGMPAVVEAFARDNNYAEAHEEQLKIHAAYLDDIARYASSAERVKARACYLSLPRQLAKENTKFQYSVVQKGGSARKYDSSVDWLENANIALVCRSVSTPLFPLAAYESNDKFRMYAHDTGMLMAMYGFDMKAAVVNDTLKGPVKGGLHENLIACMLEKNSYPLRYWISSDVSQEIEFLIEQDASVAAIEVKASRGSSASLNEFLKREDVGRGYKFTSGNIGVAGKKVTLPLYMATWI